MQEKIIILDFGSQTTQLIGRRVRELDTYCEIVPYNKFPKEDPTIKGVILSGSPFSVYDKDAFKVDLSEISDIGYLLWCTIYVIHQWRKSGTSRNTRIWTCSLDFFLQR